MLLRDSSGRSVEFHLFAFSGVDFAEDWLNAGTLSRDADGAYLVNDIDYIIDYVNDAMSLSARRAWIEMLRPPACSLPAECRSPQGEHGMFLFLTVQGGFVHADIRFNLKNCYSKKLSHKII